MALRTHQYALNKVLSRDHQFEVPSFQRPYVWETEHASQLLDDFHSAMQTPDTPYFLGSLVLVSKDPNGRELQVIDGQQRLTTLTILLSVLRHLEEDPDIQGPLNDMLLEPGNKLSDIEAEPRLRLRNADESFFHDYIQEPGGEDLFELDREQLDSPAQLRMQENYRVLYSQLTENFTAETRRELAKYISNQVNLVLVVSNDMASAHRVFNVLNTRGLPLSAADILKSQVIGTLPDANRDEMAQRWDKALEEAGDDSDRFLRELYVVITQRDSRGAVAEDYEGYVLPHFGETQDLDFIVDYLEPYAKTAREIHDGHCPTLGTEGNAILKRLLDYPTREWVPAAMWILNHYGKTADAVSLLRSLERVTGVENTARISAGSRRARITRFLKSLRNLDEGESPLRVAAEQLDVDDQLRRRAIAQMRAEINPSSALAKALLIRANIQAFGREPTWPRHFQVATVLPLKGGEGNDWPLTERERADWVRRLANMVLARASVKELNLAQSFIARRDLLAREGRVDPFPLTRSLRAVTAWTTDELTKREDQIVELISDYWDIRFTSDGLDLTTLSSEQLTLSGRRGGGSRGRRIPLREIQEKGLLHAGDIFEWRRPKLGVTYTATLTSDGKLKLPDGSLHDTPSGAAKAATGTAAVAGPSVWRRTADGRSIADIIRQYRLHVDGDG